ncbi:hypothetical protein NXS19_006328 [Fusarium pseudograminearum]|nr:hypothetical protein NXS19_006328 [Fusarium pseudograminearum]
MKATLILALPAIAMAAATPPTITGIADCLTNIGTVTGNPFNIGDIIACTASLPLNVVNALVAAATQCVRLPLPLPVKE